jgi:RecA/RadA recombinase
MVDGMDLGGLDSDDDGGDLDIDMDDSTDTEDNSADTLYHDVLDMCGGPDLIEIFGPSGSGKSVFSTQVLKEAAREGKKCLFIDTERNINEVDNIDGSDYLYIPEWKDIYYYIRGSGRTVSSDNISYNTTGSNKLQDGYDVIVLDSVGFPALVQYADYRVDNDSDQFQVFLEIESIFGHLKQYSQRNDCLIIITNQPKSDLSDESDPKPFGDKAIYGAKEVWKTDVESTNEMATNCDVNAFRSREAGRGKTLFEVKIDDSGVDIEATYDRTVEDEANEWT